MYSFFELSEAERQAVLRGIEHARGIVLEKYAPSGFNIGLNDGEAAGQTVMHCHIHLIPRYPGDMPDPRGGVRWIIPDKAKYW